MVLLGLNFAGTFDGLVSPSISYQLDFRQIKFIGPFADQYSLAIFAGTFSPSAIASTSLPINACQLDFH